ncbi:hypothetical protein NDU88_005209 [Pleurodeles waltl]|uniref:Uncharacterized protein n=1 Tax=Pleurodeles waltl TaxID=8319 RepID=A0AAV7LNG5_PLEWA|nr:hypothetical protein NDU88_005209 [Pleurodeles waltl]
MGASRRTNIMSVVNGTRDGKYSHNTNANDNIFDEDLDLMDEYVFDPEEALKTEFLDEDLEQPSTSKAVNPLGTDIVNPKLITNP